MTITYKDTEVFYTVEGEGKPVVFLHGFLENHTIFNNIAPDLDGVKAIKVDLPGHGKTPALPGDNTMDEMATIVHKILQAAGENSAYLVGHSMGGYVALAFAKKFTTQTTGVFLMNSTPYPDTEERKKLRMHGVKVALKNYRPLVSMSVANLFSNESRAQFPDEIEQAKQEALKTPEEGYVASQKGMMQREDLVSFWKKATFEKAMLLGEKDTLIDAFALKNEFLGENVDVTITDGGHMSYIENLETVNKSLKKFLI